MTYEALAEMFAEVAAETIETGDLGLLKRALLVWEDAQNENAPLTPKDERRVGVS